MITYGETLEARIDAQLARAAAMQAACDAIQADTARLLDSMRAWQLATRPETRVYVDSED